MITTLGRLDARLGFGWRTTARRAGLGDGLAVNTTDLGSMYMVAGAAAVLLLTEHRRDSFGVATAGTLGWLICQEAKKPFNRRRPFQVDPPAIRLIRPPTGTSFPSGHSAVAAAVGTYMAARSRPGRAWPWRALAVWVPLTRIQVGVHYPSDVIAGSAMGYAIGRGVAAATARLR